LEVFLTFETVIETKALWLGAYSEYQVSLHDLIVELRALGLGYR